MFHGLSMSSSVHVGGKNIFSVVSRMLNVLKFISGFRDEVEVVCHVVHAKHVGKATTI